MLSTQSSHNERLPFETFDSDFPYYNGLPSQISAAGWLIVLGGVIAGFVSLVLPLPFAEDTYTGWLRAALFAGIPLLALKIATPVGWLAIFRKVGFGELSLMIAFALMNLLVTLAIGTALKAFGTVSSNQGIADAAGLNGMLLANFFAKVGLQLLGEELITILPFLAIFAFSYQVLNLGRNASVICAWVLSAVAFGLIHLPTYNWNIMQCIFVIGSARIVLTLSYMWSKNIWVSTGAHIINDWTLIAVTTFLAPLAV